MTIEQILGSTNSAEELKNRFLAKSLSSRFTTTFNNVKSNFLENVQRNAVSIADGSIITNGCLCSREESENQPEFSDEDKKELFAALKSASLNALEIYKKYLDGIFGNEETKEEQKSSEDEQDEQPKKVEIELTSTPVQSQPQITYFGY